MNKDVIIALFLCIIAITVILYQYGEQVERYNKKRCKHSLLEFHHYVADCPVDEEHMYVINIRLRQERARREMNDPEFCNRVNEIAQLFYKRFSSVINKANGEEGL